MQSIPSNDDSRRIRNRIVSEETEERMGRIYSFIQYLLIGALGGLAITNTFGIFVTLPTYISLFWFSKVISIDFLSILIGSILGLGAAKLFHLR
jgi:hypothetical protein